MEVGQLHGGARLPAGGVAQQNAALVLHAQPSARMVVEVAQRALPVHVQQAQRELVQRPLQRLRVALGLLQAALGAHEAAHPGRDGAQLGELRGREFGLAQLVVQRQHMHAHLGRGFDDAVDHGVDAQGAQVVGVEATSFQCTGGDELLAQGAAACQGLFVLAFQRFAPGVLPLDQPGVALQEVIGHAPLVGCQRVALAGQGTEQHHLVAAQCLAQMAQQARHHAGLAHGLQALGDEGLETGDGQVLCVPVLVAHCGPSALVAWNGLDGRGALPRGHHPGG